MTSNLKQLSLMTVVVADTGDLDSIKKFLPRDATTNPSLILAAAKNPNYSHLINESIQIAKDKIASTKNPKELLDESMDQVCVLFGREILKLIPGRVSTEVDARLSFDKEATILKARKIIKMYESFGIDRKRILIKIASTWEGIKAAEVLEKEGIQCNLTLLFSFYQAVACAEAKVTLISPFVGRILDWYKAKTGKDNYSGSEDPGVISVTKIFNYFKTMSYKTEVMGASFRNIDEIKELAGCDLLTISPKFLEALDNDESVLIQKLQKDNIEESFEKLILDEQSFKIKMLEDQMASDKLAEGIEGFSKAIRDLEEIIENRLNTIHKQDLLPI
tara:strand:- start:5124 stop:6122 length:999 start_codon:yes stop_codon:yes gene_type:complete